MVTSITLVLGIAVLGLLALCAVLAAWAFKQSGASNRRETGAELLQQQVESLRAQVSDSLLRTNESVNRQLGSAVTQLQQQMNAMAQSLQSTSGQIHTRLDDTSRVVQNVSHQLGALSKATEQIFETTKNISTLEEILKPPKLRGAMGEILLENVLKEILPSPEFFGFQHTFKTGDTVDAVIKLKDGLIPVDAKFPLDNFRRMLESKDPKEQQTLRKEFSKNVKKHIDDIAGKYILPNEGTFNFALMYIPAENVYYETIVRTEEGDADLFSYATLKHVFPVSPNALYPYLMTLALGLRGLKIEQRAREIAGELARVYGDLEKFSNDFRMMGGHLSNAEKKFAEAEKKLDRIDLKLSMLKEGSSAPVQQELLEEGR